MSPTQVSLRPWKTAAFASLPRAILLTAFFFITWGNRRTRTSIQHYRLNKSMPLQGPAFIRFMALAFMAGDFIAFITVFIGNAMNETR